MKKNKIIFFEFKIILYLQSIFRLSFRGLYLKIITSFASVFSITVASTLTNFFSTNGLPTIVKSLPPTKSTFFLLEI